jgi:large subunit ribosomal protein L21
MLTCIAGNYKFVVLGDASSIEKGFIMYAIVNILGKQFRVAQAQRLYVPLLDAEKGAKVEFPDVRLFSDDNGILIGTPTLENAKVVVTVLDHIKDEKVIVFKKKRRKGYRRLRGHRQQFTHVEIDSIEK